MGVLSEKYAIKDAFLAILLSVVPSATAANVVLYVMPEPNPTTWPIIVLDRPHWTMTEVAAGGEYGNNDTDLNHYGWEYYDQLISQTGSTVEATMDTHDAFLDAMAAFVRSHTNSYLPDGNNIRQVERFGMTITSDANKAGPYNLTAGSSTLLSEGIVTVKQLQQAGTI